MTNLSLKTESTCVFKSYCDVGCKNYDLALHLTAVVSSPNDMFMKNFSLQFYLLSELFPEIH